MKSIEADIDAIREIGAFGTPAVIANGVLLARNPTHDELEDLLAAAEA